MGAPPQPAHRRAKSERANESVLRAEEAGGLFGLDPRRAQGTERGCDRVAWERMRREAGTLGGCDVARGNDHRLTIDLGLWWRHSPQAVTCVGTLLDLHIRIAACCPPEPDAQ